MNIVIFMVTILMFFSKELSDRNIHGIVNAEILDYYTYSKSYDVNIGDEIVLHERLILKALL